MTRIIVSDTGPLIALALVDLLRVLPKLFSTVYVPDCVMKEATQDATRPGAKAILAAAEEGWIVRKSVEVSETYQTLAAVLDQGEAEALALAEHLNAIALVDERRGRKVAIKRGIAVTGTAAVLIKAKKLGEIDLVKPFLQRMSQCGYRLSVSLLDEVLKLCDES
ncbi:DUF3368 domain-containing protein [Pseudomaricurvus alkylphenolicus]|uniref:DUF3368 domain-containing protein n=1 Tax=Pseudomaricurvus alkylphenolicus TaxID=1306991 RepID=UPI0014203C9E|nr:DUF3368 domain-containing protein [Pseudomaricurvus alkylphenolicus]NIB43523.1 DUF3368 domain-containing protein [Pseudomaricurvus alkylphenolicus]